MRSPAGAATRCDEGGGPIDGTRALVEARRAVEGLAAIERVEAAAIADLVAFDEGDLHVLLGYTSTMRYLEVEAGLSQQHAARLHLVIRHCRSFPLSAKALEAGHITVPYLQVLAVSARGLADEYERDEAELLGLADDRDLSTFERALHNWRHRNDRAITDSERRFEQRSLSWQRAFDGSGHGSFRLDPIGMEIVAAALETRPDPASSVAPRTAAQRRADALVDLAAGDRDPNAFEPNAIEPASAELTGRATGVRTTVDVVVDLQTLEDHDPTAIAAIRAEFASGQPISRPVLDQLLCDASYRRLLTDGESVVLDYSRSTADITPALRRAIQRRDRHCRFAGCDRPSHWCDVHHLVPRRSGGPTTERNLALVCRFHHTLIHQSGWQLQRDPQSGELRTRSP